MSGDTQQSRTLREVVNRADAFGVSSRTGTPTLDRARDLYRSMNTYDIAQLLHMPEAQVYRAVFGTRRAALLQRNAGATGSVPFHLKDLRHG